MLLQYILARLAEASTWRGIIGMATAAGITMQPEHIGAIVSGGMALAGTVGVFTKDANK